MTDNVFTLVGSKESNKEKVKAANQPHLDDLFKKFSEGEENYLIISVDGEGFTTFLTDLDYVHANYQLDKVKINLLLPPEEE